MGYLTVIGTDPEGRSEMVEVAVGRGDGRGVLFGIHRRHDLELERLRPLVLGQNAADPPEEGIVRHHRLDDEAEGVEDLSAALQPVVPVLAGPAASPT